MFQHSQWRKNLNLLELQTISEETNRNLLRRKPNLQELLRNLLRNQPNDIKEPVEEPAIEHNDLQTFY